MFRLVEADFAAAGENDARVNSPLFFCNVRANHVLSFARGDGGLQVVTSQVEDRAKEMTASVELTTVIARFSGMNTGFGGRQAEDQPATTGVHGAEVEDVAKEGAVLFGMIAVEEDVGTDDHKHKF